MSFVAEKKRLEYACRRGTRELEELVRAFLELYYDEASDEKKNIFRWLLSMEDDRLWDWIYLWGNEYPSNNDLSTQIKKTQVKKAIEEYISQRSN